MNTLFFSDGSVYHGDTLFGVPHGYGKLHYLGGGSFTGNFLFGKMRKGERLYNNQDVYVGTFKNNKKGQEAAAQLPIDRILVETDSPYLSPEPKRGKTNEPANVRYTAQKLADLRGKTLEEIAYLTNLNAHKIFKLK